MKGMGKYLKLVEKVLYSKITKKYEKYRRIIS
jgi:hypothetical protein